MGKKIKVYSFIIIVVFLTISTSCKKDDAHRKDPVITWENPADIKYGTLLSAKELNATVNVEGFLVYTPALGTKINSGTGLELKVDFYPKDSVNYNKATKKVKINCGKKNPVIKWPNPEDVIIGSLLTVTQLNANADVPGTFAYNPALGTKLNEGANQELKVYFTPSDPSNCSSASVSVKINVILVGDIDGNAYHRITIGTQVWLVENLKTTKYNDGTEIPNITDDLAWKSLTQPAYCNYNNDINYKLAYGALYNWYAVNTGKLCPVGWHVPADSEWTTLENYLITNGYNYDGTTVGNKYAKALASNWGWNPVTTTIGSVGNEDFPQKLNKTGFTSLPGGFRSCYYNTLFGGVRDYGYWWSSTQSGIEGAWERSLGYNFCDVRKNTDYMRNGLSVRCIKD
jgi:uncharacterized protein (TIGR02145 family)